MKRWALAWLFVLLQPVVASAELRCDDCDEGIALLRQDGASCLGALIGVNEIVTAGHCVYRRRERPWSVVFPATAERALERVEATVLEASFDLDAGKDFARLRLATPTSRAPYRVSTDPLADGAVVRHWRRRDVPEGEELFAARCEVVHHSFALPTADSPDAPRMVLGGCDVRRGDSGGPVVADGALIGLNQAWLHDVRSPPAWLSVDARWRTRPPLISVVSLRCAMGGQCARRSDGESREAWDRDAQRRLAAVEERVLDELSAFMRANPELYLRYVRKRRGANELVRLGPICAEGPPRVVALPRVELRPRVDAFGRFVAEARWLSPVSRRLRSC